MSSTPSGTPQQLPLWPSPSASLLYDQRPASSKVSEPKKDVPTSHHRILDDANADDSDSSGLEEGEIVEDELLPVPPVAKTVPLHAEPTRRFRREPLVYRHFHPPPNDHAYPNEPDYEHSKGHYNYIHTLPYHSTPPSGQQSSHSAFPTAHQSTINLEPLSIDITSVHDSEIVQAEKSLQDLLAMGLTYEDLIAEGMHPAFLDQLFARLQLQSPRLTSGPGSIPRSIATPELPTLPPLSHNPSTASNDVDNFLNTLETSISTPPAYGEEVSKKRVASSDIHIHPPKRRAFGVRPPRALVIDISDDDSSDGEDNEREPADDQPKELPVRSNSKIVKIPERPALTQQEVVNALKNRELAIEVMKRKIEAKMKSRGASSHDGLAQELAVSIVDKNEGTPAVSPLIRNAETRIDTWLDTPPPTNISPIPSEEGQGDIDSKNSPIATSTSERNIADPSDSPITTSVLNTTTAAETTLPPIGTTVNDDDEARLMAELEAELQLEEKARLKRRELEDRLANARGKRLQRSANTAISERVGPGDHVENAVQKREIEDTGPGEHDIRMVNMSPVPVDDHQEITVVENEDQVVAYRSVMEDVTMEGEGKSSQPEVKVVYDMESHWPQDTRFHPRYLDLGPTTGYRSLTYSNRLDPHVPLCLFELAGGVCNDSQCGYQHFRTITLSDDEIISDMRTTIIHEAYHQPLGIRRSIGEEMNEIDSAFGNAFQSRAVALSRIRNARLTRTPHLVSFI